MSRLRWMLVGLLVASTALFAVGAIAERSSTDTHTEPAAATGGEAGEPEGTHDESAEQSASTSGEGAHGESPVGSRAEHHERERVLGVDIESTPLVVVAVLAGLALAALAASRIGALRGFLFAVVAIGLAWAALDIREVVHQLDESRTAIAVVAMAVAALHLTVAANSARLAAQARATP